MNKLFFLSAIFSVFFVLNSNAQCTKGNCFNGSGTYKFENGDVYDGQWREGKPHGQGKYEFANGDRYMGLFQEGKRNGTGKYTWAKGGRYTGNWLNDKRDGFGEFQWPNSATYRGYWKDDQIIDMEVNTTADTQEQPLLK